MMSEAKGNEPALIAPASSRGWPNDAMVLCLVDGSTLGVDRAEFDQVEKAMRFPATGSQTVMLKNVRTTRWELVRASAIVRVIMPEGAKRRG